MRLALIIGSLGSFFNLYQLQALYPQLADRFGTTATEAGWLNMAALLGMMLTAPVTGAATKHANPKAVLVLGFLALAALHSVIAFTTSQPLLLALRIGQGIVIPFLLTATMNLVSTKPGSLVSLYVVGTIGGSTLSRLYPAWAADALGWEQAFTSSAALMVASAVAIGLLPAYGQPEPAAQGEQRSSSFTYARRALADGSLRVAYLAGFALLFTQSAVFTALGIRLAAAPYSWNSSQIGMVYLACLPALFFVLSAGWLRRYVGEAAIAGSLIVLVWVGLGIVGGTGTSVIVGVALFAVGTYMFQTVTTSLLSRSRLVPAGVATGFYLSFYYLGGAMGASLGAYAFEAWDWGGVIGCVAVSQALVLCLVLRGRRRSAA
ncbi:MAG: hypothetical protein CL583_03320 [Alteromonadaceae bacterium]|nr:hypothetical protein [Alteromonadaceae bacterium]